MLPRSIMRVLVVVLGAILVVSLVATMAWALATFGVRPVDGVEGDVLFEADRIRAGLPLYVDPNVGAHDYGAIPARYLVLYPPLWSAVASVFAGSVTIARVIASLAWFGLLGVIVATADRSKRMETAAFAAFVGGIWILALYGASGRPDAIAVLFSGLALLRGARRGRLDLVGGVLFALAAWTKPNVIGIAPGALVAAAASGWASAKTIRGAVAPVLPALLSIVAVSALVATTLSIVSERQWLFHLLASTGQPPSLSLWLEQIPSRAQFVGPPIAAAIFVGWRGRRAPGIAVATGGLVSATLWTVLSFAKIGSAANYLMEPCVAAAIVISRSDLRSLVGARLRGAVLGACIVQSLWTGVASVRSAIAGIPAARERAEVLASVRRTCGAGDGVVLADEPGLERMLNGRIVATPFQSTHLARRGKLSIDSWIADVSRPEARCLVMQDDLLERPLDRVDIEHDRFDPQLRRALQSCFESVVADAGYHVYRRRAGGCK